jgi:hypothetical protein
MLSRDASVPYGELSMWKDEDEADAYFGEDTTNVVPGPLLGPFIGSWSEYVHILLVMQDSNRMYCRV